MTANEVTDLASRLTAPERQALELIAQGYSTKDVARAMQVALEDAAITEAKAMQKIGARSRAEATWFTLTALREG